MDVVDDRHGRHDDGRAGGQQPRPQVEVLGGLVRPEAAGRADRIGARQRRADRDVVLVGQQARPAIAAPARALRTGPWKRARRAAGSHTIADPATRSWPSRSGHSVARWCGSHSSSASRNASHGCVAAVDGRVPRRGEAAVVLVDEHRRAALARQRGRAVPRAVVDDEDLGRRRRQSGRARWPGRERACPSPGTPGRPR